jgi:hypothetical protein
MRSRSYTLVFALSAGLLAHAFAALPAWGAPATSPVTVAQYDFDGGAGPFRDQSGKGHTMTVLTSHGGALKTVRHGQGRGIEFPLKCAAKARACPHAVLQTPDSADLDPGTRPIRFGATVRLAPTQTSKGQNVVQKGYSKTSSQYKLQVDGIAGRPSCVLVDDKKPTIKLVRSSITVADGAWHAVECRRSGTAFSIVVDGVTRGSLSIPVTLSVTNNRPLSIGGKGAYQDNDQFQGAVDDVWVRIG